MNINSYAHSAIKGTIFDIQRFSIHDGPGIRTTVFMKGCPLRCLWCHNPESHEKKPQLAYYPLKCIGCGACVTPCPLGLHALEEIGSVGGDAAENNGFVGDVLCDAASGSGGNAASGFGGKADKIHVFNRMGCAGCGRCAAECVTGALALIGRTVSAAEAIAEVKKDEVFYRNSGGGMTLSGGEPFYQPDFALALLALAKNESLHTCVETCGVAPFEVIADAARYTDIFLYDIKETEQARHKEFTGADNALIINNLRKLDETGASIILRCPIIPGMNDNEAHLTRVCEIAASLNRIDHIDLEPYHPLGISKSDAIGRWPAHSDAQIPPKEFAEKWAAFMRERINKPVLLS